MDNANILCLCELGLETKYICLNTFVQCCVDIGGDLFLDVQSDLVTQPSVIE